ncbi:MAG: hypothetical protein WCH31_05095 [Actinomycetes bacterium]
MSDVLIGLDVGTSAVTAFAVTPDRALLGIAEEPYPLSTPRPAS